MVELGLLGISSVLNILLGLFVYTNNPNSATNKLFLMLTSSFAAWSIVSYMSVHPALFSQIVWVRLVLFCAALLCLSVYLTFTVFPSRVMIGNKTYRKLLVIATGIVMSLTLTPYVFTEDANGDPSPTFLIGLFALLVITLLVSGTASLIIKLKHSSGKESTQLRIVLFGLAATFSLILVTNLLIVVAFQVTDLIPYGPSFTIIFTGSMAYAIIKHKLFDIRATVARVIAYVASIASIGFIYLFAIFGLSNIDALSGDLTNTQRFVYALIAVLSGLLFQPFKNFYDKLTNKIFYQDAYDAQSLIDNLNKNLVNSVELEELLTKSALIIQESLKIAFTTFYIRKTSYFPDRIIGAHRKDPEIEELDELHEHASKIHKKIHSAESEAKNDEEKELTKVLKKNDIEVIARLVSTLDYEVKGIGYILLGPKKSGSQYTKQDLKVVEIIANELVIATENSLRMEEIEQFNVTLQKKIDSATKELKQTNEKLRALDEAKDEFVSMASHQLRTPLTSVKGYISMVLEGDAGEISNSQRKMLGQAQFSSQRMVYLISDLLNVSRLKTGKFIIEKSPVYLPDLVDDEIKQLYEGAQAKNLTLTFTKPKKYSTMELDDMKIRQVVMNFTDNAIYYTPSGGKITVELKETDKSVEFTVTDTGIGVPKAQQPKLFTKFYRAENARKARPDGTGLGLFMAKKVIIAQGGSVIFKSTENKGSTFGFTFPKEKLLLETPENPTPEAK